MEEGADVSYSAAVSHAIEEVPDCKGYIRGFNYLIGYKITKTGESSCRMKYMMRSDVKGQVSIKRSDFTIRCPHGL